MAIEAHTQDAPNRWPPQRSFLLVFAFGTVLRLVALALLRNAPYVSDARDYVEASRLLLSGVHFVPYWPSGLPLYLLPFLAFGGNELVLRAAMLLFWCLASWGIYRLARAIGLGRYAWLVLLAFAVMPSSIQMSIEPVTQQPVAAMLLIALSAAAFCAQGAGLGEYILLGLSLGGMALIRPSALPLLLLFPAICAVTTRKLARPALSVALGCILVFAWVVRAHQLCGAWIVNNSNGANLFFGNNPWTPDYRTWYFGSAAKLGSPEIHEYPEYEAILAEVLTMPPLQSSAEFQRLAIGYIRDEPGVFVLRTLNRVRCFFGFDTFTSANLRSSGSLGRRLFPISIALEASLYLLIAGPAFFWVAAARIAFWKQWTTWLVGGAILLYAAPYWLSMSHPTYHYPIVVPMAFLALLAWRSSRTSGFSRIRGVLAVLALAGIQAEWVWNLLASHS